MSTKAIYRISSLDGLRGISILLVIIDHAFKSNFKNLKIGKLGVGIFFVISSYLIISFLLKDLDSRSFSIRKFYFKRILRIFPAYYFFLAITFGLIFYLDFFNFEHFWRPLVFLENYHPASLWKNNWLIGHTWSLAAEEQFYIIISILFLIFKNKNTPRKCLLVSFLSMFILASLFRGGYMIFDNIPVYLKGSVYRSFETVMDSFAIGGLIALFTIEKLKNHIVISYFRNKIFLLIILIFFIQFLNSPFIREIFGLKVRFIYNTIGLPVIYIVIGILLVLSVSAQRNKFLYKVLNSKVLSFIGLISYSLYLWQQVWLYNWEIPLIVKFLGIFISALVSYYLIEKPSLKFRNKLLLKYKR